MNVLCSLKAKNQEDALKYAYAFMISKLLNIKECNFLNMKPKQFTDNFLLPRDTYVAYYTEKDLPSWESFKSNPSHATAFNCVGCLDKNDEKRLVCSFAIDTIIFTYYGEYQKEAKKAFKDISSIHDSLN